MSAALIMLDPQELDRSQVTRLEGLLPGWRVVVTRDAAEVAAALPEVEIVAGHVNPELVLGAPRLGWIQLWSAGADWLLRHPEAAEMGFLLTTASGVHAVPISEHIIGMLLMQARRLHQAVRAQSRREWWRPGDGGVFELAGKTMLLVGVGAIGERTAQLASALGMRVEGVRQDPSRPAAGVAAMYGQAQLRERLPHADVVVLTVPLTAATRGMVGAAELAAMKRSAYLVNIGRGATVDEDALVAALRAGRIAGAALDVFEHEPLPAGSPLWDMENVIITGHYSGNNPLYNERALAIFEENLARFKAGERLRNLVDKRAMVGGG